ncbi:MAG: hypothetical protein M5U19_05595 [Microthrixaceae bacterium]|nr:hypothetical protein [Microthrixaceae bacterium]
MNEEIRIARSEGEALLPAGRTSERDGPEADGGARQRQDLYNWTWDNLKKLIAGGR